MSSDLKIEIFAYHIFYDAWLEHRVKETKPSILEIYGDECIKDISYSEACDNAFYNACYIRTFIFSELYMEEIYFEKYKCWECLSDCYNHVVLKCNRDDLFGHLNIFDRMFATCTYVVNLCTRIYENSPIDVVNYGHIIWAMYFDKFTEEFYSEGGWNELKRVAKTYESLSDFLGNFLEENLWSFKEASVNYREFKIAVKYDNCKYKHKCTVHISKLWVKFHTEHFEEYVRIPPWFDYLADCFELELLLQHLTLICNCSSEYDFQKDKELQEKFQETFCFTGFSYAKNFDKWEEIKNVENEGRSKRKRVETRLDGLCSTPGEKMVAYELKPGISGNKSGTILDEYSNIRYNALKDEITCPVIKSNPANSTKTTNLDLTDKFTSFDSKNKKEDSYPRTVKRQSDFTKTPNIFSTLRNQNEELECPRKVSLETLPEATDLCSNNQIIESHVSRESSRNPLDSNFSIQNEEVCNENTEITDISSANQSTANHCEIYATQKNLCTPKDSLDAIEVINNIDGNINTNKELDKLKEQNDPEIRNFLRMILVLGDRQGIQYVCGTLCNSEDGKEKSQVRANRGKKNSKKKSKR